MDAVELPSPANAVVSKLLAAAVDREPSGTSGCSSSRREYDSTFGTKEGFYLHENPTFRCEENDTSLHPGVVDKPILPLPKHDGKPVNKKSLRRLSSYPCSKRPREDQQDDFITTAGADDHGKKIGHDHGRCTFDEKHRSVKLKRSQDSKKTDKKLLRASVKTKYDPLTSKIGFTTSDPISGGNSILGIYGLSGDLHDATKHVEELPLSELLDGSYKYSNLFARKGKKASNVNEHILLSVEKACTVLSLNSAADSSVNRKASMSPLNDPPVTLGTMSGCDGKDKCLEDSFCKVHVTNLSNTSLYQPREILERLALPPSEDLQAHISSSSMNSVPSQSTMCMKAFQSTSLPPFPWSFSQSGTCKPGFDSGRLASTRNMCQGKWFRIGSYSTSTMDDENCFSDIEIQALDHSEDSISQQKVDDLVQDVKKLTESMKPRLDSPRVMSEPLLQDSSNLIMGSCASGFTDSRKLKLVDGHADSSNSHIEYDFKDRATMGTCEPEGSLRCLGSDLKLVDPSGQKDHNTRSIDGFSGNSYSYLIKSSDTGSGPSSLQLSTPETSNPGHSPGLLTAAAILCEMASCSNGTRTENDTGRRIELPKALLPNTTKACNLMTSLDKPDRLFMASRHHDPIKRNDLPMKHKLVNEKKTDFTHMNNAGREPLRWSFITEGSDSRRKVEKVNQTKDQKLLHGNSIRPPGLMPSPTRVEKVYDDQQKLRKAALKASSTALGGTYIKDWNRGRSKRL
ncbi:uncharacterized protein M6B38_271410 [Iris pallida]|uniref:Uncharacterized protein n=1 Tax=Iris pallida TaxID=29817 RepID=A0AAX6I747_IRIPA|nr:uncharacterized protein M6B38_271410 [Iris pallida]